MAKVSEITCAESLWNVNSHGVIYILCEYMANSPLITFYCFFWKLYKKKMSASCSKGL
uniref:Uncharacterized protein n=1 Tax=Anguilla anguilla TaxID=7936 RepID=A0A0E9RKA8_ANGAN